MGNGDKVPTKLEVSYLLVSNSLRFVLFFCSFPPGYGTFCLLCSCELDYVGDEEVAWDEEIEDGPVYDILPAIVMTSYAY
jgi:hypothetical protein